MLIQKKHCIKPKPLGFGCFTCSHLQRTPNFLREGEPWQAQPWLQSCCGTAPAPCPDLPLRASLTCREENTCSCLWRCFA